MYVSRKSMAPAERLLMNLERNFLSSGYKDKQGMLPMISSLRDVFFCVGQEAFGDYKLPGYYMAK